LEPSTTRMARAASEQAVTIDDERRSAVIIIANITTGKF